MIKIKLSEIEQVLQENKFVKYHDFARFMHACLNLGKNGLIYGPPGHGKSEMIDAVMNYVAERDQLKYHTIQGKKDFYEENFWGGIDIPHFEKTGRTRYNINDSLADAQLVKMEEIDHFSSVLLSLKDPIQSRVLINDGERVELQYKCIIATTNLTREELSTNESVAAFYERLPLEYNMKWSAYSPHDFAELFEARLSEPLYGLSTFISGVYDKGGRISPRAAVHLGQAYLFDPHSAKFVAGIPEEFMENFEEVIAEAEKKYETMKSLIEQIKRLKTGRAVMERKINESSTWHDAYELQYNAKKALKMIQDLESSGVGFTEKQIEELAKVKNTARKAKNRSTSLQVSLSGSAQEIPKDPFEDMPLEQNQDSDGEE